jgi:hypothetical protein
MKCACVCVCACVRACVYMHNGENLTIWKLLPEALEKHTYQHESWDTNLQNQVGFVITLRTDS